MHRQISLVLKLRRALAPVVERLEPRQLLSTATSTLNASADAMVRGGSYATTNYGTTTPLWAKNGSGDTVRQEYFKFDIASVANASNATISNVKLRLYGALSSTEASNLTFGVRSVADTAWSESGLNWNNKPAQGTSDLATQVVTDDVNRWYEFDITSYVQQQKAAGKSSVSVAVIGTAVTAPGFSVNSKEASGNKPQLAVAVTTPDVPPPAAPTGLAVTTGSATPVTLTWVDNATAEAGFVIRRRVGPAAFATIATPGANVVTYTDTTAVAGQTYDYQVTAVNAAGESAASNTATAATQAQPTQTVTSPVTDDVTVRNGSYANTNYGNDFENWVKVGGTGYERQAYLKFDINTLTAGQIQNAKLRLYGSLSSTESTNLTFNIKAVNSTTWDEDTLTWNNKPSVGSTLASVVIPDDTKRWYEIDISPYVQQQRAAGATSLSLAVVGTVNSPAAFAIASAATTTPPVVQSVVTSPPASVPEVPSDLKVETVTQQQVILYWNVNDLDATGSTVWRREGSQSSYIAIASLPPATAVYFDFDVQDGTSYSYKVTSERSGVSSPFSAPSASIDPASRPVLTITSNTSVTTNSQFNFSATSSLFDPDSWHIEWGDGSELDVPGYAGVKTVAAYHTFAPGTAASDIVVSAAYRGLFSVESVPFSLAIAGITTPLTPSQFTASHFSSSVVKLAWTLPSENARQFQIDRTIDGGTSWQQLAAVGGLSRSYDDMLVPTAAAVQYRVKATNDAGASTPTMPMAANSSLAADSSLTISSYTSSNVVLAWQNPTRGRVELEEQQPQDPNLPFRSELGSDPTGDPILISGLSADADYRYRIRIEAADGSIEYRAVRVRTLPPNTNQPGAGAPSAPHGLTVTVDSHGTVTHTDDTYTLHFSGDYGTSLFGPESAFTVLSEVWRTDDPFHVFVSRSSAGGSPEVPNTAGRYVTSISLPDPGVAYAAHVRVVRSADQVRSPWSDIVAQTTAGDAVNPLKLQSTIASYGHVAVSWSEYQSPSDQILLFGELNNTIIWSSFQSLPTISAGENSVIIDSLPLGSRVFAVVNREGGGRSGYSNFVDGSLGGPPAPTPAAPSQVHAAPPNFGTAPYFDDPEQNRVTVNWRDESNNEDGFRILRRVQGEAAFVQIATVDHDVTRYVDGGPNAQLLPDAYEYRVEAFIDTAAATAPVLAVNVWPPGYLVAFDGTYQTENSHPSGQGKPWDGSVIFGFDRRYHAIERYFRGIGNPIDHPNEPDHVLQGSFALEANRIVKDAYDLVVDFYQDQSHRDNVPLDVIGYSRGAFQAAMLTRMILERGVPDLAAGRERRSVAINMGGNRPPIYGFENTPRHSFIGVDGVKVRLLGLLSPVAQFGADPFFNLVGFFGALHLNIGLPSERPGGVRNFIQITEGQWYDVLFPETPLGVGGTDVHGVYQREFPNVSHGEIGGHLPAFQEMLNDARSINVPVQAI